MLMGLMYSLIIVFNTAGPFLIQTQFHHSSVFFGHLAFCLGIYFLLSTILCRFLLKQFKAEQLFLVTINTLFSIALLLFIDSYLFSKSIFLVSMGSAVIFFGTGFIFPMSMGKAMTLFRHIAGTAIALMYSINVLLTSMSRL